jgi:hypothetical protein
LNYLLVENEKVGQVGVMKYDFGLDSYVILCYIDIRFCRVVINEME